MLLRVEFQGYTIGEIEKAEVEKAIAVGIITDYQPDKDGAGYAQIHGSMRGPQQIKLVAPSKIEDSQDLVARINRRFFC